MGARDQRHCMAHARGWGVTVTRHGPSSVGVARLSVYTRKVRSPHTHTLPPPLISKMLSNQIKSKMCREVRCPTPVRGLECIHFDGGDKPLICMRAALRKRNPNEA